MSKDTNKGDRQESDKREKDEKDRRYERDSAIERRTGQHQDK